MLFRSFEPEPPARVLLDPFGGALCPHRGLAMRWTHTPPPEVDVEALSRHADVSRVLAELLLRAGITAPEAATAFLEPALSGLHDPFLLPNVAEATDRLCRAIAAREDIIVLGDYDVDGVSSTALLVMVLRSFGLNPRFVVPRRSEDGYGLSRSAIDRALEAGRPSLFIALDCGTNSLEESRYLRGLGIEVMIIDHHRSKEGVVADGILINPHVAGGERPAAETWLHLCTVGLVFKLCHGLLKRLRQDNHPVAFRIKLRDHLDLHVQAVLLEDAGLVGQRERREARPAGHAQRDLGLLSGGGAGGTGQAGGRGGQGCDLEEDCLGHAALLNQRTKNVVGCARRARPPVGSLARRRSVVRPSSPVYTG